MNNIIITGNLTRGAEMRYLQDGKALVKVSIANNEGWGDNKQTNFINCTAFGKTAEAIANYTDKGSKVLIEGRLSTGSYEKDGARIYTTEIIINKVEFLSKKNGESNEDIPF